MPRCRQDNNGGQFFDLTRRPAYSDLQRQDKFGRLFVRSNAQIQGAQNTNPNYLDFAYPQRGQNDRFQGNVQARGSRSRGSTATSPSATTAPTR